MAPSNLHPQSFDFTCVLLRALWIGLKPCEKHTCKVNFEIARCHPSTLWPVHGFAGHKVQGLHLANCTTRAPRHTPHSTAQTTTQCWTTPTKIPQNLPLSGTRDKIITPNKNTWENQVFHTLIIVPFLFGLEWFWCFGFDVSWHVFLWLLHLRPQTVSCSWWFTIGYHGLKKRFIMI